MNLQNKLIIFTVFSLIILISCGKTSDINESAFPTFVFNREALVDVDYIFQNESLNQPFAVRINPVTNEIVVVDNGNNCIYFFSKGGEFIHKAGQAGQGPGDLLNPQFIAIDNVGDIYVYDELNRRISIFDKNGSFITTFRVNSELVGSFAVDKDRNIIINSPSLGNHNITVFSREGIKLKEIGEITHFNENERINTLYASGMICLDNNDNYVLLFKNYPMVKVYNKTGQLLQEKLLDKELQIKSFTNPAELTRLRWHLLFSDIIFRNNNYYILRTTALEIDGNPKIIVDVLNSDFGFVKRILLPIIFPIVKIDNREVQLPAFATFGLTQFEIISENENILLSNINSAEIYLYKQK